jgi:hypothetical protein
MQNTNCCESRIWHGFEQKRRSISDRSGIILRMLGFKI